VLAGSERSEKKPPEPSTSAKKPPRAKHLIYHSYALAKSRYESLLQLCALLSFHFTLCMRTTLHTESIHVEIMHTQTRPNTRTFRQTAPREIIHTRTHANMYTYRHTGPHVCWTPKCPWSPDWLQDITSARA